MGDDSNSFVDDVLQSFRRTPNSEFEELSPDELKRRYPCINMGDNVKACYDPQAGVIMADKALKVLWVMGYSNNMYFLRSEKKFHSTMGYFSKKSALIFFYFCLFFPF